MQVRMSAHCLSSARVHCGRARELAHRRDEWARGPGLQKWEMWLAYVVREARQDLAMLQDNFADQLTTGDRLEIAEIERQLDRYEADIAAKVVA